MTVADGPIATVVVDASKAFLKVASEWVVQQPFLRLAGTASTAKAALASTERLRPDLLLIDVGLPDLDGFEVTRRVRQAGSAKWIVVLSFFDSKAARDEAWASGADAFVSKTDFNDRLLRVIRELAGEREPRQADRPAIPALREPNP